MGIAGILIIDANILDRQIKSDRYEGSSQLINNGSFFKISNMRFRRVLAEFSCGVKFSEADVRLLNTLKIYRASYFVS